MVKASLLKRQAKVYLKIAHRQLAMADTMVRARGMVSEIERLLGGEEA